MSSIRIECFSLLCPLDFFLFYVNTDNLLQDCIGKRKRCHSCDHILETACTGVTHVESDTSVPTQSSVTSCSQQARLYDDVTVEDLAGTTDNHYIIDNNRIAYYNVTDLKSKTH